MNVAAVPVVVIPTTWQPPDGTTWLSLHRSPCPSAEPGIGHSEGHEIDAGQWVVYLAGAWRCLPCADRISRRDGAL